MSDADKDVLAYFGNAECTESFRQDVEVNSTTPIPIYIKNLLDNRVVDIQLSATGGVWAIESIQSLGAGDVTRNWITPDPVHRVVGSGVSQIILHMTGKEVGSGYKA